MTNSILTSYFNLQIVLKKYLSMLTYTNQERKSPM